MLTKDEQAAVDTLPTVTRPCSDKYCEGCDVCTEPLVLLGDALQAIDDVRNAKKLEREKKLAALLDDY